METKHFVYLSAILLLSAGLDAMPFNGLLLKLNGKTTSTSLPKIYSKSPTTFKPVQTTIKSAVYHTDKIRVSPDPVIKIDLSETNKTSQGDHSISNSTTDKVSVPPNKTGPADLTTAEENAHHHNKEEKQSSYPYFHPEFQDDVDDALEIEGVVTEMKENILHVLGLVNENKSEKNSVHLSLQVNFNYKPKYHAVSVDVSGNTLTGKVPIPVLGHAHKDIFENVFHPEKEN